MAANGMCGTKTENIAVSGLLPTVSICLGASPESRENALWMLSRLAECGGGTDDARDLYASLWERETLFPTGMGEGIAIPHTRAESVRKPCMAALTVPEGMEYPSLDGEPVRLLFMIATPEEDGDMYMDLLAQLSGCLLEPGVPAALWRAGSPLEFQSILIRALALRFSEEKECYRKAI